MNGLASGAVDRVAPIFGVTRDELLSKDRSRLTMHARTVAIWLARTAYGLSYPELGRAFGMHETSCMDACRRVDAALATGQPARIAMVARSFARKDAAE
jgi:chromosomal replication initiation ATPase DnaA